MSEPEHMTTYSAAWLGSGEVPTLPAASVRQMARDDLEATRAAADAEAQAQDRAEGAQLVARQRGMDTTLAGVFARAERASKADDYRSGRRELATAIADGQVDVLDGTATPVTRSADAGYETDRLIERLRDDRTWIVQYEQRMANRRGRGAEHVEAKRQEAEVRRSQPHAPGERVYRPPNRGEVVRSTPEGAVLGVY